MGKAFSRGAEFSVWQVNASLADIHHCGIALLQFLSLMKRSRIFQTLTVAINSARLIFLGALAVRFWVLSQLLPAHAWRNFYQYNEFARIAWAMVSGYGYSSPWANTPLTATAVEPPIYAYILAAIFKLAGPYSYASLWLGVGLNAVLSAFTAVLIFLVGKRDFNSATGILAAWVWSAWIYEAAVSVRLWESSLAAFLLMIALWWLPQLARSTSPLRWSLFGGLAGVAALTNTTLLSVFPCLWCWLWSSYRRQQRSCRIVLLASVTVFVLTLVPWTIRNYVTFGRLMPIRDNFGLEVWIGNHEGATESHQYPNAFPILDPTEYNQLGELHFMAGQAPPGGAIYSPAPSGFPELDGVEVSQILDYPCGHGVASNQFIGVGRIGPDPQAQWIPRGTVCHCSRGVSYHLLHHAQLPDVPAPHRACGHHSGDVCISQPGGTHCRELAAEPGAAYCGCQTLIDPIMNGNYLYNLLRRGL